MVRVPSRPTLTIAVGVLLLVNPLYVDALHLDQPSWYRYRATEVTYGPDGLDWPLEADGIDDDVACLRDAHPTRACALERAVHDRGNVTAPVSWGGPIIDTYGPNSYEYAYVGDAFYEVEARERGGNTILSLNRTPADDAMRDVATPVSRTDRPIRKAVRTGSVRTHRELDGANRLLREGDTYYVVYRAAAHVERGGARARGRFAESALTVLGIAVGLLLVLRGQRARVERERSER